MIGKTDMLTGRTLLEAVSEGKISTTVASAALIGQVSSHGGVRRPLQGRKLP